MISILVPLWQTPQFLAFLRLRALPNAKSQLPYPPIQKELFPPLDFSQAIGLAQQTPTDTQQTAAPQKLYPVSLQPKMFQSLSRFNSEQSAEGLSQMAHGSEE